MPALHRFIAIAALLLTALVAGLFFGYSCSVNPGLGRLGDAGYLQAMQSINAAILNPAFLLPFMVAPVALLASAWMVRRSGKAGAGWLLAAALVYSAGVLGVTMAENVPLNEALARLRLGGMDGAALRQARLRFEKPWNTYHDVRTACSVAALMLALVPFVKRS